MLNPNFSREISPLTTQYIRQSTKSSLSRILISFNSPNFIKFYCLFLIYCSILFLISNNNLILSNILCSIINFSIQSVVWGIWLSFLDKSTTNDFIYNDYKSNFDISISYKPGFYSLNLSKGNTIRSLNFDHVDV